MRISETKTPTSIKIAFIKYCIKISITYVGDIKDNKTDTVFQLLDLWILFYLWNTCVLHSNLIPFPPYSKVTTILNLHFIIFFSFIILPQVRSQTIFFNFFLSLNIGFFQIPFFVPTDVIIHLCFSLFLCDSHGFQMLGQTCIPKINPTWTWSFLYMVGFNLLNSIT